MKPLRDILCACCLSLPLLAAAQQDPPQWSGSTPFIGGGLVRGSDGNFYRATHNSTGADPTRDNHSFWELYYVRAPVVLSIAMSGARFTSLKQAWAFVSSAQIPTSSSVTLSISSAKAVYLESFPATFSLNQDSGGQIFISGDDPTKVTLQFPSGVSGFTLTAQHTLGGINNVTIDGTKAAVGAIGLSLTQQSSLSSSVFTIRDFQNGVMVGGNSSIHCEGASILDISGTGIQATGHSYVDAASCIIDGGGAASMGIFAFGDTMVHAPSANVSNMMGAGFQASTGSTIEASAAIANKTGVGFDALIRSTISVTDSTSTNNATGYLATGSSYITATGATTTSNATNFNPAANTSTPDGSYIAN